MTLDEKYPYSSYSVIKQEAARIITELETLTEPNSPDKMYYVVKIDPHIWPLMNSAEHEIFSLLFDFPSAISKITGLDGYYVMVYYQVIELVHHKNPLRVHPRRLSKAEIISNQLTQNLKGAFTNND